LRIVKFDEFERFAREVFEEIPVAFREGVDGLVVRRDAPRHPDLPDVYTLGECLTEEHLSDYGSADTTRSVIALYWGSFRQLAREREDFDWEEETWETLTHELRHHLESLAGDDALEGVDYAADQTFLRIEGEPFDPWYYQYGEEVESGLYRVEKDWYLEQPWDERAFNATTSIPFTWHGRGFEVPRPDELGDVHFVAVDGLGEDAPDGSVEIVLVRRRGWWDQLKRLFGLTDTVILESAATAEPVGAPG
jgi:predicted Zn-dependent protease with MMP-like domain